MIYDKNKVILDIDDMVEVPSPEEKYNDTHISSFVGNIIDIDEDSNTVSVEDSDGDVFDIEAERVEMV